MTSPGGKGPGDSHGCHHDGGGDHGIARSHEDDDYDNDMMMHHYWGHAECFRCKSTSSMP